MVSTRGHPSEFPEPDLTPSRSPRKSNGGGTSSSGGRGSDRSWAHTPSNLTIIWLFISLPLVIWDTGYVLLRPLTMPGGSLHWPIWVPYGLYGRIDYMYGWKAVKAGNGFTSAQGFLNLVETLMYIYYLYLLFSAGRQSAKKGRGAAKPALIGFLGQQRTLEGRTAAIAVLVAYSAAVMTLSKTVLYWLNEYYSGFSNIGHNNFIDLFFLWIVPNGAWLILPTYMVYVTSSEIIQGLSIVSDAAVPSSDDTSSIKVE